MTTFDQILPIVSEVLNSQREVLAGLEWLLVNRDLNGRVRFIVPDSIEADSTRRTPVETLASSLLARLEPHAHSCGAGILYEPNKNVACQGGAVFALEGFANVWLVDRLATEGNWAAIAPETTGAKRIVFFSIKGGVGRSTALAATAWALAQAGKRVLVVDLDLESPGLSSSLLPDERRPEYGITDWLVEDLVDNTDGVLGSMIATSDLAHDGEIYVVPAHGAEPGEYISKLGRVWMPKLRSDGTSEPWSARLQRLEEHHRPDVVLLDSRAGIDEIASTCVTDLGANLVLLFALEGNQTWNGYRMLFEHWQRADVARTIRDRLKCIAALVPETERIDYLEGLREHAYQIFVETLYDEIAPPPPEAIDSRKDGDRLKWRVNGIVEGWNFDEADEGAPHTPWPVYWHRSFAGLRSLQGRIAAIDPSEIASIFGPLIEGIIGIAAPDDAND